MSHTPGPWIWSEDGRELQSPNQIEDESGFLQSIVSIDMPDYITPEDKALIAAAPDLLAALKVASDELVLHPNSPLRKQIDAAIAKAEGAA